MAKLLRRVSRATLMSSFSFVVLGIMAFSLIKIYPTSAAAISSTLVLGGERIRHSSITAVDFDGDGDKELVVGGQDGMLYVIAYQSGSWSVAWSRQTAVDLNAAGAPSSGCDTTKSDIRSAVAVGDLDKDGHQEIVVTTGGDPKQHRNGGVLIYRYTSKWSFSLVPGWPQPKLDIVGKGTGSSYPDGCWDGIWGSPVLGDVDGDGDLEIAVEGFDRRLHLWHHDGTYVTGWPIASTIHRGGWSTPAMADIDKDELPELIFATDDFPGGSPMPYLLFVFNGDGSLLSGFPVQGTQNFQSSPAVGDIDGDGWLDIVVGTGTYETSGGNKVYAWDHSGNLLANWPKQTGGNMPASPALGDLDGDDDLEVVIGCGSEGDPYPATCTNLYAWHGDGSSLFTVSPLPNNPWSPPGPANGLPYGPIIADYDGDSVPEILVLNRWSWGISTVGYSSASGTWVAENDTLFRTNNTLESTPIVDDVDGDGQLEVAIGGADSTGNYGMVYIWDVNGGADADLPWPMFHRDVARTGLFPLPPELSFPTKIRALHQYGSGSQTYAFATLENVGGGNFDWDLTHTITRVVASPESGTVTDTGSIKFTIDTTGILTGWHTLGTVQVAATSDGEAIAGSPGVATIYVYVGDVFKAHLPLVLRSY